MKARNLRIGNLIGWYEGGEEITPVKVVGLGRDTITVNINGDDYTHHENYQSHKPLEITGELCIALGMTGHHDSYYNDVFCLSPIKSGGWKIAYYPNVLGSAGGIRGAVLKVEYVHQIQNIFEALTLTEMPCQL